MKQTNKLKMIATMAVSVTVALFSASCSNDEFFGFDNLEMSEKQIATRASSLNKPFADYLSISSNEVREWTEKDFISFSDAIKRLGVNYSNSKQKYIYNDVTSNEINISDSLYDCMINMLELTNTVIKNSSKASKKRLKKRSPEGDYFLPDCVPAAIAHMGQNAPTYAQAIAKCDELFPNWRTQNGVSPDSVEYFIEFYAPVTEYTDLSFCSSGVTYLPNILMGFATHVVNAYRVSIIEGLSVIYYEDYSSTSCGNGFILGYEMRQIFPFDINSNEQ